jgi:ATP-dependent helicase/nuclease subunit A
MSQFTSNQRRAIQARGNVLVVAGAGTGKTRTLVQRCVEWLVEAPGLNTLDQVLMVTFTEAAASEMRQRIRSELKQRLEREPANLHLVEQLALLDTAFISTLHSFCLHLVRQHFYDLALDPQVAVLPAEEAHLLAEETLASLLEAYYAAKTVRACAVQRLVQDQARGWDLPLRRLMMRLHHYGQTLPDPEAWLHGQRAHWAERDPDRWREWLRDLMPEWRSHWLAALEALGTPTPNVSACSQVLRGLPAHPTLSELSCALERMQSAWREAWPRGSAGAVRDRITDFIMEVDFLRALTEPCRLSPELRSSGPAETEDFRRAAETEDPLLQDWCWTRSHMSTLLELTAEFGQNFAQAKRDRGVVDFHDLEQFSLCLLRDRVTQKPTPLSEHWRQRIRLVFIDEYQDINAAQDAVLSLLAGSGAGANRFLVGDPKQSIYRFRLADPHIFQAYAAAWTDNRSQGQVIPLSDNFRSREGILAFINAFFAPLMRADVGNVPYDDAARLTFGNPADRAELSHAAVTASASNASAKSRLPEVELHLRLPSKQPDEAAPDEGMELSGDWSSLTTTEKEARLVGSRLLELRAQETQIWDARARCHRAVQWRDMVILLRAPQRKVEGYAKEFCRLGIPLIATRSGFLDALGVSDLLNLLTLLDNPLQDRPLLAVLRSPLVALSFDELALIRMAAPGGYWHALQQFHNVFERSTTLADPVRGRTPLAPRLQSVLRNPGLGDSARSAWDKTDLFLRRFSAWRRLARQTSLSQCLNRILRETQYDAWLPVQARGQDQRGNVLKLLAWARQFDQFQGQGLYRFLKFIEAQREAGIDHEPAPADSEQAVRLMSIHQSKGLEFGVVVVADLGKAFNLGELRADIILDQQYGLCPLVKPPGTQQRYPSLPYWLAQRRQRRESLGEEMRLLYVAMTRACQCLILVGTATRSAAERWTGKDLASARELLSAKSYLDWIGPWMAKTAAGPDWTERAAGQSDLLRWSIYEEDPLPSAQEVHSPSAAFVSIAPLVPEKQNLGEALGKRLSWRYPFAQVVGQGAKFSVSALSHDLLVRADEDGLRPTDRAKRSLRDSHGALSPTAVGIAHHTYLQFVSLDEVHERHRLEAEADRLERMSILSPSERAVLDVRAVAAFWRSEVGQAILRQKGSVRRELPFTLRLPLSDLQRFEAGELATSQSAARTSADEFVIVTGVVDLAVLLPREIWIVDFKTDAVDDAGWVAKAQSYAPQMQLYHLALHRIYNRPVTRTWLHSLVLDSTVALSNSGDPDLPRGVRIRAQ